jgi:peptide-methionine (S)-S-oxide reductase
MYYADEEQKELFAAAIDRAGDLWDGGVVTQLEPLGEFFEAEEMHQDFFAKNPGQGYCMAVAVPKVNKVRKSFAEYIAA